MMKTLEDLYKNHKVLKGSKTSWNQIAQYFSKEEFKKFDENTIFNEEHKKLFSEIHNCSKKTIEDKLKNNMTILNSLFKGTDEFEDPFCATWLLINGKLTKTVRNPNYRGVTTPFWNKLKMVGNQSTFEVFGTPNCGKGEPNQCIRVGHASPTCLFKNVEVFGGI